MAVVGIVAEYNPFHRGHALHLAQARALAGADATLIVCMSGNWVQRGDCAVADKWTRSRWACQSGADLVVELPTVFALASAETFAQSAVAVLHAAGSDALSFGCEDPDLEGLQALADALDSPAFHVALRPFLAAGLAYPAAREKALAVLLGPERAALVRGPNNNLAVEYLRSLRPRGLGALPIKRQGVHDGPLSQEYPSASAIRQLLRDRELDRAEAYLAQPWTGPVYDSARLEMAILCKLRQMAPEALAALPDGGDGLGQRLWKAVQEAGDLAQLYDLTKTRRHTLSRIRRLTLWAGLGLTQRPEGPEYLRVLAMTGRGAAHLADIKETCPLPILTKSADHKELLATEARLTDLFSLCAPRPLPCGQEWRSSPAVV